MTTLAEQFAEVAEHFGADGAPPARLRTLTTPAFAAAKLAAWIDRGASRDLWDLAQLAIRGLIDAQAAEVFRHHGPFSKRPGTWVFASPPSADQWRTDLAHQTRLDISAQQAADLANDAWQQAFRATS